MFWTGVLAGGIIGVVGTVLISEMSGGKGPTPSELSTIAPAVESPGKSRSAEPPGAQSEVLTVDSPPAFEVGDPRLSFRQTNRAAEQMALEDPAAAIRAGMQIPGHDNREAFLETVFRTWAETNGDAAAVWATGNLNGADRSDGLYYVAEGWAESDPATAAEWFTRNTVGVVREDASWEILESWGRKDPQAALRWTDGLEPTAKQNFMDALAEGWAAIDPEAARQAGMAMLSSGETYAPEFLRSVATQWTGSDPQAAAEWGSSLPDERLRASILDEVTEGWAQTNPQAAAEWTARLSDPGSRRFAQAGVAAGWSEHDPAGAVQWAAGLNDGTDQSGKLVREIVNDWAEVDPQGAVRWIESRSSGPEKDAVLEAFSDTIVTANPEAAIAWAQEIADPSRRSAHLQKLSTWWIQREGASAIQALDAMNLPLQSPSPEN
jgi:hypothetical protein